MAKSVFVLIDCNNFFVSCERVFRPDLADKPVAVLSNNDGCIVARSNEVKKLGVPMGAPEFKWRDVLGKNDVTLFSANFLLYGDFSRRVVDVLSRVTPHIEVYSVDESFLETGSLLIKDYAKWGQQLRQRIYREIGIPVSLGIGPSKTLAKAATEYAKQEASTNGVVVITETALPGPSNLPSHAVLSSLPIEDVWGVGRRLAPQLRRLGLRTALDLAKVSPPWARQHLTIRGERMVRELKGESCFPLADEGLDHAQKSLAVTRSFGHNLRAIHELEKAVATFATRAATKLRRKDQIAAAMVVFISTGAHAQDQFRPSTLLQLEYPTNDTSQLVAAAVTGLERIYDNNFAYRKAGVILTDLRPGFAQQTNFAQRGQLEALASRDRLMASIDTVNRKYGTDTLKTARQGAKNKEKWQSKRERVSPAYTTKWTEIAVLGAR